MAAQNRNFLMPIRVYYEDTDAGGVVYHARYLHFFERARTEHLRALSFSQQQLLQEKNIGFVVRNITLDYHLPAKLDDWLIVETAVESMTAATINFKQRLKRKDLVLCTATVKIACVDLSKMKPVALPSEVKAAFSNIDDSTELFDV